MRLALGVRLSVGVLGRLLAALVLVASMVFPTLPARAANEVFTVHDVKVDVTADSARDARVKALDEARSLAFRQLLERMTVAADHARLPAPSPAELVDAELSVEVAREKASSVRYIAEVTYSFRPELVHDYLRRNGLSYSESQARPMLVVPVLVLQGAGPSGEPLEAALLWEPENDWAPLWSAPRFRSTLLPVVTPLGDTEDLLMLTADAAREADWATLEPLAARYGASEVLVATAHVARSPDGKTERVDVELRRVSAAGEEMAVGAMEGMAAVAEPGAVRAPVISRDLAIAAIDMAMAEWSERWKERTLISLGEQSRIAATAIFRNGLADWATIRRALAEDANVLESHVRALSATGAELEIVFAGSIEQLALTLAQRNVSLSVVNNLWVVEAGSQASGIAPSLANAALLPPIERAYMTPGTDGGVPAAAPAIPADDEDWNRARDRIDPNSARMSPIPGSEPRTGGQ